jgi:FdrA protein
MTLFGGTMIVKTIIKKGAYFDSVSLMQISKKINSLKGVKDSAVVMATKENKNIIKSSGLLTREIEDAGDNDLAIAVSAVSEESVNAALKEAETMLKGGNKQEVCADKRIADSIDSALSMNPELNMALISVNGKYAGSLAQEALNKGLNLMIFSDNVDIETEIKLKKDGLKKNLLVMGPDCGTAIINGAPLGFANRVNKGNIAIIGPSGTGIQEISCLISNLGGGISQAIGTGTRDVKEDVGAITTIYGLNMLKNDPKTNVIVIVSKPPQKGPMNKILSVVKKINKPVVAIFLGSDFESKIKNLYMARNLHEAALKAFYLSKNEDIHKAREAIYNEKIKMSEIIKKEKAKKSKEQKYLRGLFSGGTFASQALCALSEIIGDIKSNIPLSPNLKLKNSMELEKHSIIDLGEDEFTFGRPHPMIDYTLRNKILKEQSKDKTVSAILLDIVLGYGSNMSVFEEISPAIKEAFKNNPRLTIIAAVTGTDMDPQDKRKLVSGLKKEGVFVFDSNYLAAVFAGEIVRNA